MIPRYSRPEMVAIWSPETKFRIWFEIEAHACDAMAELGTIPKANAEAVWRAKDADFDVARIDEIEAVTKHDVIAFLTHLSEIIGADAARFVHQGMTSSDVLDTTFNIQLVRAADILIADVEGLLAALKRRAFEHRDTVRIGRSHGIHGRADDHGADLRAVSTPRWTANLTRLKTARQEVATGAISGAVGTFANIDPAVEAHVCQMLGLTPEPISTQVIPRDRHAAFFAALGVVASSVENVATEIRHMQRTEAPGGPEVELLVKEGKGGGAPPHKTHPGGRDTSGHCEHSACGGGWGSPEEGGPATTANFPPFPRGEERGGRPGRRRALRAGAGRTGVIDKLVVVPPRPEMKNLDRFRGLVHSQRVLLALTQAGVSREDAYGMVQRNAMKVWEEGADFMAELKADPDVRAALSEAEIEEKFDLGYHTKHVDTIFARVFNSA